MSKDERSGIANKLRSSLADTRELTESVGVEIADEGNLYAKVEEQINNFAENGIADIKDLIKAIEEYNNAVQEAGTKEIKNTSNNIIAGSLD
jgi:RNA binding exosome subunit